MSEKLTEEKIEELIEELLQERTVVVPNIKNDTNKNIYKKVYNQTTKPPGKAGTNVLKQLAKKATGGGTSPSDLEIEDYDAQTSSYYGLPASYYSSEAARLRGGSPPPTKNPPTASQLTFINSS